LACSTFAKRRSSAIAIWSSGTLTLVLRHSADRRLVASANSASLSSRLRIFSASAFSLSSWSSINAFTSATSSTRTSRSKLRLASIRESHQVVHAQPSRHRRDRLSVISSSSPTKTKLLSVKHSSTGRTGPKQSHLRGVGPSTKGRAGDHQLLRTRADDTASTLLCSRGRFAIRFTRRLRLEQATTFSAPIRSLTQSN
jgi:hypothetical protein